MKKYLLFATISLFSAHLSIAQDRDSIVTLPEVIVTSSHMVNEAVDKAFLKKFSNAEDIVWSRLNKDYLARFIESDLKHQALFQKNGRLSYDIAYMGESRMPEKLAEKIRQSYPTYKIKNAARVVRANQQLWIVNIESLRSYMVLRAEDDDLEEIKHIVKSE
jgi:hypothetical protein